MGAQQSSDRGEASDTAPVAKTCYYDLLGVERQATDDEYASSVIAANPGKTNIHKGSKKLIEEKPSNYTPTATTETSKMLRRNLLKYSLLMKSSPTLRKGLGMTPIEMLS